MRLTVFDLTVFDLTVYDLTVYDLTVYDLAVFDFKHGMGADLGAKAATRAFCLIQS
jgi:hypothetical protein